MLDITVLGPLSVLRDAEPVSLTRPLERRLLAVLLANRTRALSDDQIIEAVWSSRPPASPTAALQTSVSRLRSALGEARDVVQRIPSGYRLDMGEVRLDADVFEQRLTRAGHEPEGLRAALAAWAGEEAFDEFRGEPSIDAEADRLADLKLGATEQLFAAMIEAGEGAEAVADLELMVKAHPLREAPYELLMRALHQGGRQREALRTYEIAKRVLGEQLGLEPSRRLADLEERILLEDPSLDTNRPAELGHNVPNRVSSLVGREAEIERVLDELSSHRLVTVTGPGGVGKTTIATEAARRRAVTTGGITWMVELAGVGEADRLARHIGTAVAAALRSKLPDDPDVTGAVAHLVGTRSMLLVLDNGEHVVQELARIARTLLERCPGLALLVTSRERLGLFGEAVQTVDPLGVPPVERADRTDLESYDAFQLLVERVRAVDPDGMDDDEIEGAIELCRRLDGLPLALELAAARAGTLSVTEIARQIDERHAVLGTQRGVSERHTSLQAAMEWSHQLLTPELQHQFQILSAMRGPFSVNDAAHLLETGPAEAGRVLAELQGKSLVVADPSASPTTRYEILGTLRDHARSQAAAAGRTDSLQRAHVRAMLALGRRAVEGLAGGPMQLNWMNRIAESLPDFQAAIPTMVRFGDHDHALEAASGIAWFFVPYRRVDEGYELLAGALAGAGDQVLPHSAAAHTMAALLSLVARYTEDDLQRAVTHLASARRAAEETGDQEWLIWSEVFEASAVWYRGDVEEARRVMEEVRDGIDPTLHPRAAHYGSMSLGVMDRRSGVDALREAVTLARQHDDHVAEGFSLAYLGATLRELGDYRGSAAAYHDSLLIHARFGFPMMRTVAAAGEAMALALAGEFDAARDRAAVAVRFAAQQHEWEGPRSYELLLIDPNLAQSAEGIRGAMRSLFRTDPADQPTEVLCLLLGFYHDVAGRRLSQERVDEISSALDRL